LNEELDAVGSLKDWERGTLRDVDPNFNPDDDSDAETGEEGKEAGMPTPTDSKKDGKK